MTPQARFKELLKDIEPSATTKANAKSVHNTLRSHLGGHEIFGEWLKDDFLSGSYKRDTAIRPRIKNGDSDRPDVDIIVVTYHDLSDDPIEVVDLLYEALSDKYSEIRKQARSIGIFTPTADMDVVPIIEPWDDGNYWIPDRREQAQDWIETNPPRHTEWTIEINDKSNGRFKPLVKMMKWWRRINPTISKRPKGFVIECIVAECMDFNETHYGKLFVNTLESVVKWYAEYILIDTVPYINDPGVPGNSVTEGISFAAFEGFYNKSKDHAEIGRKALEEKDQEKATKLWRKIFGDRFPSPKKESSALLKTAAAVGNLSFPDRPIKPNKPGGFA
ncbi:MAG: nucleotidyltransferase [Desulfobacteraceae bacterium]|nr:nucleotidyltransferase [Desulfobacteraceae bacterium]